MADWISAFATLGTLLTALAAVWIARNQIRMSREMEAFNSYEQYHHLILQYPLLGAGGFDYTHASEPDRRQYIVFVMSMLLTMERVMVLRPKEPSWDVALEDDLLMHKDFLCSVDFAPLVGALNADVAAFIERTAAKDNWDYKGNRMQARQTDSADGKTGARE